MLLVCSDYIPREEPQIQVASSPAPLLLGGRGEGPGDEARIQAAVQEVFYEQSHNGFTTKLKSSGS